MIPTILALAFSMLVALTALAEAQCAWVLWGREYAISTTGRMGPTTWWFESGREKKSECDAENERRTEFRKGPISQLKNPDGSVPIVFYHCVPDTVDPRPKRDK
jgi:hypothetical protein